MEASHDLTPSQARFIEEHRARRERFAARATPDSPILCLSASARSLRADVPPAVLPDPPQGETPEQWAQRQIQRYKPTWFAIVEEVDPPKPKSVPVRIIQNVTAKHYGVTSADLLSERRPKFIAKPRQVAVYLTKMLTPHSLPEIGRRFGGRDHTTILFSFRKIERLIQTDDELKAEIESIALKIERAAA